MNQLSFVSAPVDPWAQPHPLAQSTPAGPLLAGQGALYYPYQASQYPGILQADAAGGVHPQGQPPPLLTGTAHDWTGSFDLQPRKRAREDPRRHRPRLRRPRSKSSETQTPARFLRGIVDEGRFASKEDEENDRRRAGSPNKKPALPAFASMKFRPEKDVGTQTTQKPAATRRAGAHAAAKGQQKAGARRRLYQQQKPRVPGARPKKAKSIASQATQCPEKPTEDAATAATTAAPAGAVGGGNIHKIAPEAGRVEEKLPSSRDKKGSRDKDEGGKRRRRAAAGGGVARGKRKGGDVDEAEQERRRALEKKLKFRPFFLRVGGGFSRYSGIVWEGDRPTFPETESRKVLMDELRALKKEMAEEALAFADDINHTRDLMQESAAAKLARQLEEEEDGLVMEPVGAPATSATRLNKGFANKEAELDVLAQRVVAVALPRGRGSRSPDEEDEELVAVHLDQGELVGTSCDWHKLIQGLESTSLASLKQFSERLEREQARLERLRQVLPQRRKALEEMEQRGGAEIRSYQGQVGDKQKQHRDEIEARQRTAQAALVRRHQEHEDEREAIIQDIARKQTCLEQQRAVHERKMTELRDQKKKAFARFAKKMYTKALSACQDMDSEMKKRTAQARRDHKRDKLRLRELERKLVENLHTKQHMSLEECAHHLQEATLPQDSVMETLQEEYRAVSDRNQEMQLLIEKMAKQRVAKQAHIEMLNGQANELQAQMQDHPTLAKTLRETKARILVLEDQVREQGWQNDIVTERLEKAFGERDELYFHLERVTNPVSLMRDDAMQVLTHEASEALLREQARYADLQQEREQEQEDGDSGGDEGDGDGDDESKEDEDGTGDGGGDGDTEESDEGQDQDDDDEEEES